MNIDANVFWPSGERDHFALDRSRLDAKALNNANNMLMILSINGTFVRASLATGRAQTLTWLFPSPPGSEADVRVLGIAEPVGTLAVVVATKGQVGAAHLKAALKSIYGEGKVPPQDIESVLGKAQAPTVAVVTFGPKTDAAVDEAYGLALYLGAALNG